MAENPGSQFDQMIQEARATLGQPSDLPDWAKNDLPSFLNQARQGGEPAPTPTEPPVPEPIIPPAPPTEPPAPAQPEPNPEPEPTTPEGNILKEISAAIEKANRSVGKPTAPVKESWGTNNEGNPQLKTVTYVNRQAEKDETAENKRSKSRDERVLTNLQKMENYLNNATRIERERARLKDRAAKASDAAAFLIDLNREEFTPADIARANKSAEKATKDLENYERENLPQELIRGEILVPDVNPANDMPVNNFTETETNYRDNIDRWLEAARQERNRAQAEIKEENKPPELKAAQTRAAAAEAAKRQAEERADAAEAEKRRIVSKYQNQVRELEAKIQESLAASAEPTPPPTPEPEPEPELEAEEMEAAPVDTRNRAERIRDFIFDAGKGWLKNLDPRDRDWAWRIGAAAGVAEGVVTNLTIIPGGRLALAGLNFLSGQAIYGGAKVARLAEISYANQNLDVNQAVQEILDINDRYTNANRYISNALLGLSAGLTYSAIGGLVWSGAEGLWSLHLREKPTIDLSQFGKAPETGVNLPPPITPDLSKIGVTIPDHGNFWSAWHINSSFAPEWTDLHNGVHHSDVVKDMVVKLARANGHELGIVHAGDQIRFSEVLTADQIEVVKKAAAAKSYNEYLTSVRPLYRAMIGK